jgi:hypothetical protein
MNAAMGIQATSDSPDVAMRSLNGVSVRFPLTAMEGLTQ